MMRPVSAIFGFFPPPFFLNTNPALFLYVAEGLWEITYSPKSKDAVLDFP